MLGDEALVAGVVGAAVSAAAVEEQPEATGPSRVELLAKVFAQQGEFLIRQAHLLTQVRDRCLDRTLGNPRRGAHGRGTGEGWVGAALGVAKGRVREPSWTLSAAAGPSRAAG